MDALTAFARSSNIRSWLALWHLRQSIFHEACIASAELPSQALLYVGQMYAYTPYVHESLLTG